MTDNESRRLLTGKELQEELKILERSANRLAQNTDPALKDYLNRYIQESESKKSATDTLCTELNLDEHELGRYLRGETLLPKRDKDYKRRFLVKICLILDLEASEANELLKNSGLPLSDPKDAYLYAIINTPHKHTISEWNQILKKGNYTTLDLIPKERKNRKNSSEQ